MAAPYPYMQYAPAYCATPRLSHVDAGYLQYGERHRRRSPPDKEYKSPFLGGQYCTAPHRVPIPLDPPPRSEEPSPEEMSESPLEILPTPMPILPVKIQVAVAFVSVEIVQAQKKESLLNEILALVSFKQRCAQGFKLLVVLVDPAIVICWSSITSQVSHCSLPHSHATIMTRIDFRWTRLQKRRFQTQQQT